MTIQRAIELERMRWTAEKVKFVSDNPDESEMQMTIINGIKDAAIDLFEACEACASARVLMSDGSLCNELHEARKMACAALDKALRPSK